MSNENANFFAARETMLQEIETITVRRTNRALLRSAVNFAAPIVRNIVTELATMRTTETN